jgi:hypothetical protein
LDALVEGETSKRDETGLSFISSDLSELQSCPDNGQATGLRCKHINLIGALTHIAEEAFDRIGALKVSVHGLRKVIKRQKMLLILSQASDFLRITLSILGLKGSQMQLRLMLVGLLPNSNQLCLNVSTFASGNGI